MTDEEFLKFKRVVIKHIKRLDGLVSDCFTQLSEIEAKEDELVDEAIDRATRAQRAIRRLEKRMGELESGTNS